MPGQRASAQDKEATAAAKDRPLTWRLLLRRAVVLGVAWLVSYLLLPKLTRLLAAWPRLAILAPAWMLATLAAEVASFACYIAVLAADGDRG